MFVCGRFCIWICAEFRWKSTISTTLDLTARPTDADDETPRLIAQLHLEIILTGKVPPDDKKKFVKQPTINRDHLTDDAFRPKLFNVRIEDGCFATPVELSHPSVTEAHDKVWTKCLVCVRYCLLVCVASVVWHLAVVCVLPAGLYWPGNGQASGRVRYFRQFYSFC
jgi:hypothetical protein